MARGWESKSVESQQTDSAVQAEQQQPEVKRLDPEYLELVRKKEILILSRTRVLRELETSQNPRYHQILSHALTDLNTELSKLTRACAARAATA